MRKITYMVRIAPVINFGGEKKIDFIELAKVFANLRFINLVPLALPRSTPDPTQTLSGARDFAKAHMASMRNQVVRIL